MPGGRISAPNTTLHELFPPTSDGESLFTAVREQLGLALEAARAPVDVIVIDGAQRPAEN